MDETRHQESDAVTLSLIRRVEAGDLQATEALVGRFQDRVFRFLMSRGCSYHDARDLTQNVLCKSVTTLANYDPHRSPFEGWLLSIARNDLLTFQRSSAREARQRERFVADRGRALEAEQDRSATIESAGSSSEAERLRAHVAGLPTKYRRAMELVVEGKATVDIAAELRLSEAGVRKRVRKGLERLRAAFERDRNRERRK